MIASNPLGFLFTPIKQWQAIAEEPLEKFSKHLIYPFVLALLPAVAWYYGITEIGWTVADGEPIKLTKESALPIIVLFYIAMVSSVVIIGYMIHWMSETYEAKTSVAKGIAITGYISTPMFLAGLVGFYPLLWLDLGVGIIALSWSIYLLYVGIPIAMKQPKEQGFLYASAIVGVCLVILICIMVGSVILWDFGAAPVFTD